jgi:hypothetical protein
LANFPFKNVGIQNISYINVALWTFYLSSTFPIPPARPEIRPFFLKKHKKYEKIKKTPVFPQSGTVFAGNDSNSRSRQGHS